ncbi:hypothetical protein MMC07_006856 [Pseudocyphellaria aurata]|nr:hypothetical protein [Pseudocyphellaria aurata]
MPASRDKTTAIGHIYGIINFQCGIRLLRFPAIPEDIEPSDIRRKEAGLFIAWANDGHESFYTYSWLHARTKRQFSQESTSFYLSLKQRHTYVSRLEHWSCSIAENPPRLHYEAVMKSDEGVKEWTSLIRKWGFCFVDECPVTEKATQELLERIAFIRHTHYGGFWQFTSNLAIKDSAYTQLALAAHTDTTYFTDPVGLHSFHLLSHTDGEGGSSLLVDGFSAAQVLRMESPESFDALCRIKVRWHSSGNEGVNIMPDRSFPVLTLEESQPGQEAKVSQVRWNNDDRAAIHADDPKEVAQFYAAARKWVEILRRPSSQYWHQLRPGRFVGSQHGRLYISVENIAFLKGTNLGQRMKFCIKHPTLVVVPLNEEHTLDEH